MTTSTVLTQEQIVAQRRRRRRIFAVGDPRRRPALPGCRRRPHRRPQSHNALLAPGQRSRCFRRKFRRGCGSSSIAARSSGADRNTTPSQIGRFSPGGCGHRRSSVEPPDRPGRGGGRILSCVVSSADSSRVIFPAVWSERGHYRGGPFPRAGIVGSRRPCGIASPFGCRRHRQHSCKARAGSRDRRGKALARLGELDARRRAISGHGEGLYCRRGSRRGRSDLVARLPCLAVGRRHPGRPAHPRHFSRRPGHFLGRQVGSDGWEAKSLIGPKRKSTAGWWPPRKRAGPWFA